MNPDFLIVLSLFDKVLSYLGFGFLFAVILYGDFGAAVSSFANTLALLMGPVVASYWVLGLVCTFLLLKVVNIWLMWRLHR